MSAIEFGQMIHLICNITGKHKIPPSAESTLFSEQGIGSVETRCKRCKSPLRLTIDTKDKNFYIIKEI